MPDDALIVEIDPHKITRKNWIYVHLPVLWGIYVKIRRQWPRTSTECVVQNILLEQNRINNAISLSLGEIQGRLASLEMALRVGLKESEGQVQALNGQFEAFNEKINKDLETLNSETKESTQDIKESTQNIQSSQIEGLTQIRSVLADGERFRETLIQVYDRVIQEAHDRQRLAEVMTEYLAESAREITHLAEIIGKSKLPGEDSI